MSDDITKLLSELIGENSAETPAAATGPTAPLASGLSGLLGGLEPKSILQALSQLASSEETENRCRLLSAVRPYLPEEKAGTLETAILMIRLGGLAETFFGQK